MLSFPCWELFEAQSQTYRDKVLPKNIRARLAVEAGVSQGWKRWVGDAGDLIAIDRYGASAPGNVVMEKLGFSVENLTCQGNKVIIRRINSTTYRMSSLRRHGNHLSANIYVVGVFYFFAFISL